MVSQNLVKSVLYVFLCNARSILILNFFKVLKHNLESWDMHIIQVKVWKNHSKEHKGLIHYDDVRSFQSATFTHHNWQDYSRNAKFIQIFLQMSCRQLRDSFVPKALVRNTWVVESWGVNQYQVSTLFRLGIRCYRFARFT